MQPGAGTSCPTYLRTPQGVSLFRLLEYPLARAGERICLRDRDCTLTFSQAHRQAAILHRHLVELGAAPGDRIAIILPNSCPFVVVELAILRAGMVKVPLNIRFHVNEVVYALRDCEPKIVFCDEHYAALIADRRDEMPTLNAIVTIGTPAPGTLGYAELLEHAAGEAMTPATYGPDDLALIRYTGGTTGKPKGVAHTERSLAAIVLDQIREMRLAEDDVALHLGHLSHGLNFTWPAYFAVGAAQILRERFEPRIVIDDIARFRVTCTYMVPTMIHRLLSEDGGEADVTSLRTFMYSSAPMPVPLLERAIARYGNIFLQVYTLSEAPVISTIMRPEEHLDIESDIGPRLASCGREVMTMEFRLLDDAGNDVPQGETGEIAIRSANNMAGYWRLPEITARTIVDGWLHTGDMARRANDGYLYLVDRKNDVIITGGFNVYPKEVEDILYLHPGVAQCAVVGVPDEEWGEAIRAFIVLKPDATADAEELLGLCRAHLAGYKKPRSFAYLDALPLTPVGKIMRRALRDLPVDGEGS